MPPKAKRFSGVYLNEHEIEEIINRSGKVLDFSGANLAGDQPLFIVDNILSHKLYQFIAIDISSTKISLQGLESLVLAATQMNSLESFDCKDNNVGSSGGNILSKFLSSTKSLKALDISSNDLGDTGVTSVASAFSIDLADAMRKDSSSLFTLVALDLSNNNLGDMAILSLCRSLTQLIRYSAPANKAPALEVLHLNNNSIGDKAAICLAQLINSRRSGDNKASLQLKELGLNDNPISSKGIIALLGSAAEGARSPLRLLLLNRCQPSIGVLNHLATNIRSSYCDLECLEMSFTAKNARLAVMDSAALYSDPKHQASSLSMTFKTLIDAIFNHVCSIKRIHLGMLHEAIFETCVEATREFMSAQQRDTTHALENINTASEIFGVPYVSNVLDWVKAGLYDNTVLFGKPVDMVIRRRSSDSESLKFELKAPAKANSNFLSNLSTQLKADEGITSTKENGFHKSIKSQLQVDRDNHTYKSISTSIGVVSTQSKNKLDLDDTELSMENKSLVDLKEKEYLKLRTEHKVI